MIQCQEEASSLLTLSVFHQRMQEVAKAVADGSLTTLAALINVAETALKPKSGLKLNTLLEIADRLGTTPVAFLKGKTIAKGDLRVAAHKLGEVRKSIKQDAAFRRKVRRHFDALAKTGEYAAPTAIATKFGLPRETLLRAFPKEFSVLEDRKLAIRDERRSQRARDMRHAMTALLDRHLNPTKANIIALLQEFKVIGWYNTEIGDEARSCLAVLNDERAHTRALRRA